MENVLLVINPVSGRQKARGILYRIVDFLSKNNCKTTVFVTAHSGHATELVRQHSADVDKIICCGGDGTLNEIFSGLVEIGQKTPVGYIPTGTSNDIARSLGFNYTVRQLLDISMFGRVQELDIGRFNDSRYFSYVTSFGAFSKASYETPQWLKNSMGRVSYFFYALSELAEIHPQFTKVIADGRVIEGDFVLGTVSNSTVFGGMEIFPKGSVGLDDGKFELLLVKPLKRPKDLQAILQGMIMHQYNEETVIFLKAKSISFEFNEKVPWTVDGEYAGAMTHVNIENIKSSAKVLIGVGD